MNNLKTDFILKRNESIVAARSDSEMPLVDIALDLLKSDLAQVLDASLELSEEVSKDSRIVVGTPESTLLKPWFDNGVLSNELLTHAEAFQLVVADGKLLIAGADRRGVAYGIMELSRKLGVSPWEWWADAVPPALEYFTLPADYNDIQWPDVEFRGIFINDEDVGFDPWATGFEPNPKLKKGIHTNSETRFVVGPKTYSKVFELLIRLRANTLWPAMHECTMPFYLVEGNAEAADRYGIMIGTSHCEPMNCNSNGEWAQRAHGDYNYITNREEFLKFWRERLDEIGQSDNLYTIGMRGIHDGPMNGTSNDQESKELLLKVFEDQRALLSEYSGKPADQVPQVFIPYKEVFDVYRSGLEVPPEVALMWCDDNYGYALRLSNEDDRKRSGGSGIYYHISYWGMPFNYLWLCTNHPGQIFRELKRAYDNDARRLWIINVGDIKPAEYQLTLTMDMAWSIEKVADQGVREHLKSWLATVFGPELAPELTDCMMEFYRLAWIRKTEGLNKEVWWWDEIYPVEEDNDCSEAEALHRLEDYTALEKKVQSIKGKVRPELADAWFEIIEYPVFASAAANRKHFYGEMAKYGKVPWSVSHVEYERILSLTRDYNSLERWNGMMGLTSPNFGPFNGMTKEVRRSREQVFKPEVIVVKEFQGIESLKPLAAAYGLGHKCGAAILPVGNKARFQLTEDCQKIQIAMIPTHPVDGDQLRYRVLLDGEELAVVNIYAEFHSWVWCWNVVRNQTVAELDIAESEGVLEIEALDEELLLDCIKIIK